MATMDFLALRSTWEQRDLEEIKKGYPWDTQGRSEFYQNSSNYHYNYNFLWSLLWPGDWARGTEMQEHTVEVVTGHLLVTEDTWGSESQGQVWELIHTQPQVCYSDVQPQPQEMQTQQNSGRRRTGRIYKSVRRTWPRVSWEHTPDLQEGAILSITVTHAGIWVWCSQILPMFSWEAQIWNLLWNLSLFKSQQLT